MIGFLTGIAVNIICSQLPGLVGAPAEGDFPLEKALLVLAHPSRVDTPSLTVGLAALVLLVALSRTPLGVAGSLIALGFPSLAVAGLGLDVVTVDDIGDVPSGLPIPGLPELSLLSPSLLTGAMAVAAIVLVQGAAVAEMAPDPGRRPQLDRDFVAHGAANVASGLLSGIPVGGSVSESTLNRSSGARTRWASILSAVWLAAVLLLFSGLIARVAMPTLAAVLILAGFASLRPHELVTILRTGQSGQIATLVTFVATLVLTVPAAVGIGVVVSLAMQLNRAAIDLRLVRLERDDGGWLERPAPARLESGEVVVLEAYGSLFFAGARTLQNLLPVVGDAQHAAVVLRLRGRTWLGVTSFVVLGEYADQLATGGGRLYLSGVDPALEAQIRESQRLDLHGPVRLFDAVDRVGESTAAAYEAAEAWEVRATTPAG
jgi:sulfate permease, SulP family